MLRTPGPLVALLSSLILVATARPTVAKDFVFDVGDTRLPQGSGERIIGQLLPQLAGRGFGPALEQQLQPSLTDLGAQLRAQIDARLDPLDFGPFAAHSATAAAAVARAASVDHASHVKLFSLTVGGAAALSDLTDLTALQHPTQLVDQVQDGRAPVSGVAPGVSATLGMSLAPLHLRRLGFFDPSRLQLYASAMHLNFTYNGDDVRADTSTYGGHLKYQVLLPGALTRNTLVRWGGLNVATGLTYASTNMAFHTSLPAGDLQRDASFTATVSGQSVTETVRLNGAWSGDADISARLRAYTLPIEVSSYLQLLYVFTLFGGVALDINWGRANIDASARAPLNMTATSAQNSTPVSILSPRPTLAYALERGPTRVDGRGFLGIQLNAGVLALFAQGMFDTSRTVMANAGLRVFY